jgi:hypothetical protein
LGADIVDFPKKDHMYKTYRHKDSLWGHGFTYAGLLDDIEIDRSLDKNDYDFVFYSIHWSMQHSYDINLHLINQFIQPKNKIAILDGHDWPKYCAEYLNYTDFFFKREIETKVDKMYPIWFSLPEEKIVKEVPKKTKDFSFITPGSTEPHWPEASRQTHIYTTEEEYYKDYKDSYFGLTCKKGGWDCMRHYEILANGCIPIFTDIENCPEYTCNRLPKGALIHTKQAEGLCLKSKSEKLCYTGDLILPGSHIQHNKFNHETYYNLAEIMLDYTKKWLTTKALAEYISGIVGL